MSTKASSTESASAKLASTESASAKLARTQTKYPVQYDDRTRVDFASPTVQDELRAAVAPVPSTRAGRNGWFSAIARDATLAVAQARALGGDVLALDSAFASLLTGEAEAAALVRSRSGEVVCRDHSVPGTKSVYTLLPELLASQVGRDLVKLKRNQLVEWRIRLVAQAGLIDLPYVELRPLPPGLTEAVEAAYEGLRLLIGCRWFLEYGEPTPFSASFIESWCGVTRWQATDARDALRRHGVIREVGLVPSGKPRQTQLFLPGGDE